MHEASLVQALFDRLDAAIAPHTAESVRTLTVRIGELAGVDGDLFRTAFDVCRVDRGYASARLEVVREAAAWRCRTCSAFLPPGELLRCSTCGGEVVLAAGGGLFLDRVDMEVLDV
jgi:hydrogenase nickel incorporation protein HypA/HybF